MGEKHLLQKKSTEFVPHEEMKCQKHMKNHPDPLYFHRKKQT